MLSLERDIDTVERRLTRAAEEHAVSLAEVNRLKSELNETITANHNLKRRLDALGGGDGSRNVFGLSSGSGLHLTQLDLVECRVSISNKTNMDVSLDGWTVRVISGDYLNSAERTQGEGGGGVVVKSPGSSSSDNRRDSLVKRRHAFVFPFDFMLAAGSDAVIR
jgi:hypothetical protein